MLRLIIQTKEETKRSWNKKTRPTKKKTPTTRVALVTKVKTGWARTLTKTRTATCPSRTILKKKLTLQRWKRKIGSNTHKEAQRCHRKDGKCEDSMLERPKKWNGDWRWEQQRHRVRDGWWKLLNGTLNSIQDTRPVQRLEDQGKHGKMTSTNSSNLLRKRQKTLLKAAAKSTKHGSTQQKTAEDGLYSKKKVHNDFRRTTGK